MSLGDGSGLSAADIMALANNNDGFGGGAGFQGVYDKMAQSRYDDLMAKYNETLQRLNRAENAASQNALAQTLIANNQAQTDRIMDFMNPPYARPFYGWPQQQPCCGNS